MNWKHILLAFPLIAASTSFGDIKALPVTNVTSGSGAGGTAASLETIKSGSTLTLVIPAPRGQIVDRGGRPLAQTKVAHMPAIQFPKDLIKAEEGAIIDYGNKALVAFNKAIGNREADYWLADPQTMVKHCKNRNILPLQFGRPLEDEKDFGKLEALKTQGVTTVPIYLRSYPRGKSGGHIIGYVQKVRPLPVDRPVENGDALFWEWKGAAGLEKAFDEDLKGTDGKINIIFDAEGREIRRDTLQRPIAGKTVVTTLDANMQKLAEDCIYHRSSMVVMDSTNGELLAMASEPGYDPNKFIPEISAKDWDELQNGDGKPMFARAFQATYPPASTFKVPMCLAFMKSGKIDANTYINCGAYYDFKGFRLKIWDHSRKPQGSLNIQKAIALSNNVFMVTAALRVGAELLMAETRNFGFGQKTGIPLDEEAGSLPTGKLSLGATGHLAIGQAPGLEATPLQVAQAMTGVATGDEIWRARLIKQVQDQNGNVTMTTKPEAVGHLNAPEKLLAPIRRGMLDVVHASYGTGKQGYNSYAQVAAKTGTAEWRGDMQMVWFAGYVPANAPQYSFAVAFEGGASGGRTAAPIVKNFFTRLYGQRDFEKDLYAEARLPGDKPRQVKKAVLADNSKPGEEATEDDGDDKEPTKKRRVAKARDADDSPKKRAKASKRSVAASRTREVRKAQVVQQAPPPQKKKSFLGRIFGR